MISDFKSVFDKSNKILFISHANHTITKAYFFTLTDDPVFMARHDENSGCIKRSYKFDVI